MLFAASQPAFAFKPELHSFYTMRAAKAVAACPGLPRIEGWHAARVALGTLKEDKTDKWQRITNWHYAPTDNIKPPYGWLMPLPLLGHRNLKNVFAIRLDELSRAAAIAPGCLRGDLLEKAGRVLHFLQDMRVPGHVTPIHHGSILGEDGFDGYIFDYDDFRFTPEDCEELDTKRKVLASAPADQLGGMLENAVTDTRNRLQATFVDSCTAEEIFWCAPGKDRCRSWPFSGFGSYRVGPDGEEVTFGTTPVYCRGKPINVDGEHYKDYFRKGYHGLMRDSAAVLLYANELAGKCDSP